MVLIPVMSLGRSLFRHDVARLSGVLLAVIFWR
jgi:hypothetical protein